MGEDQEAADLTILVDPSQEDTLLYELGVPRPTLRKLHDAGFYRLSDLDGVTLRSVVSEASLGLRDVHRLKGCLKGLSSMKLGGGAGPVWMPGVAPRAEDDRPIRETTSAEPSPDVSADESHRISQRREVPAMPEWPAILRALPVQILLEDPLRSKLERANIFHVGQLSAGPLSDIIGRAHLDENEARRLSELVRALQDGELDPVRVGGSAIVEELEALIPRSSIPDWEREVDVLIRDRGLTARDGQTLVEIGESLGVSPERARQLRLRAEAIAEERLKWIELKSVALCRSLLHRQWGLIPLEELCAEVEQELEFGEFRPKRYLTWILRLLGDPRLQLVSHKESELLVGPPLGSRRLRKALASLELELESTRAVTVDRAVVVLTRICPSLPEGNAWPHASQLLRRIAVEVLPGVFSNTSWTRSEWAEFVLEEVGEPLHYSTICERANRYARQEYSEPGFNTLLNSDPRFVRVGAGDFSLKVWGAVPYGRFDEVIERYLAGVAAPQLEKRIIADLQERYTVREGTIIALLNRDRDKFRHFGGGFWGLNQKKYEIDTMLLGALEEVLGAGVPIPLPEIVQRLCRAGHSLPDPVEVHRALVMDSRFVRHGTQSPGGFVLRHGDPDEESSENERSRRPEVERPREDELLRLLGIDS